MNVTIVGGTSQVAAELSYLFREDGHSVHPTVRSRVSASFLSQHDFDYRIADVTDTEGANDAVGDADIVVIAAFARQYAHGFSPKQARETNESIIRGVTRGAPKDATIVYFSSIAAFGDEVDFSNWDSYGREKRHAESVLFDACEKAGKDGYALRMGPVYGPNQDKTGQIRDLFEDHLGPDRELHLSVAADKPTNAIHTVTIKDAILTCHEQSLDRNTYTLVNSPRWTWKDLITHYAPSGTRLHFHPTDSDGGGTISGPVLSKGKELLESNERSLRAFTVYFPERVNQRIFNEYIQRRISAELSDFDTRNHREAPQFDEPPAPGPFIDELTETDELLDEYEAIRDVFETKPID